MYLYAKNPYEAKYQYLINNHEDVGKSPSKNPKAFIEYSDDMQDVYKNIKKYNLDKENKVLIAFDDMITGMINNKKPNSVVTELFIRGKKIKISIVFIT